jgi:hypothetical protein
MTGCHYSPLTSIVAVEKCIMLCSKFQANNYTKICVFLSCFKKPCEDLVMALAKEQMYDIAENTTQQQGNQ